MTWSLNEVESLARKAARGSGLSWGLAEEAGKATRWLTSHGLPGPKLLAALLTQNDQKAYDTLCPVDTDREWRAKDDALCPLITGSVICDHASRIATGNVVELGKTSYPLMLVPYIAGTARITKADIEISWNSTRIAVDQALNVTASESSDFECVEADKVVIQRCVVATGKALPVSNRGDMSVETAKFLNEFAHRTYAPDTPESRLAGAGAGLTDND